MKLVDFECLTDINTWSSRNHHLLTKHEMLNLYFVMQGYKNYAIAKERKVSQSTVKNQLSTAMNKLAANTREHAAFKVMCWLADNNTYPTTFN